MITHSKKNILLVITNLSFGGAQNSFHKLSNELSKRHNLINVVFSKENIGNYQFSSQLLDLDKGGSSGALSKAHNFLRRIIALKKIKREHKIDVTISFLEGADYVNILSKNKETLILSIRGSKLNDPNIKGFLGWVRIKVLIPVLYKFADHIVVVTKDIKKEIKTLPGTRHLFLSLHRTW